MEQHSKFRSVMDEPGQFDFYLVPGLSLEEQRERKLRAVLIGAGNVAFHLAPALERAGICWVQVLSRNAENAGALAARLRSKPAWGGLEVLEKDGLDMSAQLYFLAVRDEAVPALASCLREQAVLPQDRILVHVSGALPLEVLKPDSGPCGVLYFLQTFSKSAPCPDFSRIPVCIEASDSPTLECLERLARSLSGKVRVLDSRQRSFLHLGGVFACNYVNFMYTVAYDLFQEQGIDFSLLAPLMEETLRKAEANPPFAVQTGPAARGDAAVLARQEALLASSETGRAYLEVYRLLAKAVQERAGKKI